MNKYKEVEFWDTDDSKKNQNLVMSRKFGCYLLEKVEDKTNQRNKRGK